jgi:integrase
MLIAYASPRRGEVEKIEWPHVDLARGVIQIPKGKTVGRPVAIHPELVPWLEGFGELANWRVRSSSPGRTSAATSPPRASAPACRA